MKKILVTGGAGYIGSHTVLELINQGYAVVVLDDLRAGHKELVPNGVVLEKVALENSRAVLKVFEKHKPEAVIDFAAYLAVGESMKEPEKYFQNNVENFISLLDTISQVDCKYIIKSSTAATYGNPTKDSDVPWIEAFTEEYKPAASALLEGEIGGERTSGEDFLQRFIGLYNEKYSDSAKLELTKDDIFKLRIPMSIYGVSKMLDEIILEKYNKTSGIKYIALRYFNVCGADPGGRTGDSKPKPTTIMALAMAQLLGQIDELSVFGDDYQTKDGTGIRDYIHPSDLATGHVAALKYLANGGKSEIINLGTSVGSSVFDVIRATEEASGKKIKYRIVEKRAGDPSISIANPEKAIKLFKWRASHDLDSMAKTAWQWETIYRPRILGK